MSTVQASIQKSTIVRSNPRYRYLAGAVERWAPSAGAALAERLWFTVPAVPEHKRTGHESPGRSFSASVNGREVYGQSVGAGPVVYLVHGWGGWAGQLSTFVQPLVAAGHRVVSYDAPSHGRSAPGRLGPRRSNVVEMAEALVAVAEVHGPAAGIVAHSLGCTAAAFALRAGLGADRMVFVSPMADPQPYLAGFVRALGFGPRVLAGTQRLVARRVGLPLDAFDVPRVAREVATPPLVVIHDRDDHEISWSDGASIAASWPETTLVSTTGLGHRRILRDRLVIEEVTSFLRGAFLRTAIMAS